MKLLPFSIFGRDVVAGVAAGDVLSALPFPAQLMHQVHGVEIVEVTGVGPEGAPEVSPEVSPEVGPEVEADALVTRARGVRLMVKTADCIPLVLADEEAGVVAAVHAGWRGLTADIVPLTVARLVSMGALAERLKVGVGPSLGVECSEFSDPFEEIPARYHWAVHVDKHVDLWAILERQLREAGIGEGQVEWMRVCTCCSLGASQVRGARAAEAWFSWRRDKTAARFGTWVELV